LRSLATTASTRNSLPPAARMGLTMGVRLETPMKCATTLAHDVLSLVSPTAVLDRMCGIYNDALHSESSAV
jgi:hypothetical protein